MTTDNPIHKSKSIYKTIRLRLRNAWYLRIATINTPSIDAASTVSNQSPSYSIASATSKYRERSLLYGITSATSIVLCREWYTITSPIVSTLVSPIRSPIYDTVKHLGSLIASMIASERHSNSSVIVIIIVLSSYAPSSCSSSELRRISNTRAQQMNATVIILPN